MIDNVVYTEPTIVIRIDYDAAFIKTGFLGKDAD